MGRGHRTGAVSPQRPRDVVALDIVERYDAAIAAISDAHAADPGGRLSLEWAVQDLLADPRLTAADRDHLIDAWALMVATVDGDDPDERYRRATALGLLTEEEARAFRSQARLRHPVARFPSTVDQEVAERGRRALASVEACREEFDACYAAEVAHALRHDDVSPGLALYGNGMRTRAVARLRLQRFLRDDDATIDDLLGAGLDDRWRARVDGLVSRRLRPDRPLRPLLSDETWAAIATGRVHGGDPTDMLDAALAARERGADAVDAVVGAAAGTWGHSTHRVGVHARGTDRAALVFEPTSEGGQTGSTLVTLDLGDPVVGAEHARIVDALVEQLSDPTEATEALGTIRRLSAMSAFQSMRPRRGDPPPLPYGIVNAGIVAERIERAERALGDATPEEGTSRQRADARRGRMAREAGQTATGITVEIDVADAAARARMTLLYERMQALVDETALVHAAQAHQRMHDLAASAYDQAYTAPVRYADYETLAFDRRHPEAVTAQAFVDALISD